MLLWASVLGLTSCGAVEESEKQTKAPSEESSSSEVTIVCPKSPAPSRPSGPCTGEGICVVEVQAKCAPGASIAPATPPVFACECVSEAWSCTVKAGGFGVVTCP